LDLGLRFRDGPLDLGLRLDHRFVHCLVDGCIVDEAAAEANAEPATDAGAQRADILVLVAAAALGLGPRLTRAPQRDRAAERFELDVGAAVAERERHPLVASLGAVARQRE